MARLSLAGIMLIVFCKPYDHFSCYKEELRCPAWAAPTSKTIACWPGQVRKCLLRPGVNGRVRASEPERAHDNWCPVQPGLAEV